MHHVPLTLMVFVVCIFVSCNTRRLGDGAATHNAQTSESVSNEHCTPEQENTCKRSEHKLCIVFDRLPTCSSLPASEIQGQKWRAVWSEALQMYVAVPPAPGPAPLGSEAGIDAQPASCQTKKAEVGCPNYCQPEHQECWKWEYKDEAECRAQCRL